MNARKVILDCDPGIDDALALMLALSLPGLDVVGITVVCGNVPVEKGVKNALKILELMNRTEIGVYAGEETRLFVLMSMPWIPTAGTGLANQG